MVSRCVMANGLRGFSDEICDKRIRVGRAATPDEGTAVAFLRRFHGSPVADSGNRRLIRFRGYVLSPHRTGTPSDARFVPLSCRSVNLTERPQSDADRLIRPELATKSLFGKTASPMLH